MIRAIEHVLADVRMESGESRAKRVLKIIEAKGMLPPSTIYKLGSNYSLQTATHVITDKVTGEYHGACAMNIWEDE